MRIDRILLIAAAIVMLFFAAEVRADNVSDDIRTISSSKSSLPDIIAAVKRLGKSGADKAVDPLIQYIEKKDNPLTSRQVAVEALATLGNSRAIPALLNRIANPDDDLYEDAAKAMDKFTDAKYASVFAKSLSSPKRSVRRFVVRKLSDIKSDDDNTVNALKDTAKNDKDLLIRNDAMATLARIAPDKAGDVFSEIACNDGLPEELRKTAVMSMVKMSPGKAIESLSKCLVLKGEKDAEIKESAKKSFKRLANKDNIEHFVSLFDSPSEDLRLLAVETITGMQDVNEKYLLTLADVFLKDKSLILRKTILQAFRLLDNDNVMKRLADGIGDKLESMDPVLLADFLHVIRNVKSLGHLEGQLINVLSLKVRKMNDEKAQKEEDINVSKAILQSVRILTSMKSKKALDKISKLIEADDVDIRCAAIFAMSVFDNREVLPIVIKILENIDAKGYDVTGKSRVISSCVRYLGDMKEPKLIDFAKEYLSESKTNKREMAYSAEVRGAVVISLYKLGTEEANQVLMTALSDPTGYVRKHAIKMLVEHKYTKALPKIIENLNVANNEIQIAVFEAITEMGGEDEMIHLQRGLQSSDPDVVLAALEAIRKIGSDSLVPKIIDLLKEDSLAVRNKSYEVLKQLTGQDILYFPAGSYSDINNGHQKWSKWWSEKENKLLELIDKSTPRKELLADIEQLGRYRSRDAARKIAVLIDPADKELTLACLKAILIIGSPEGAENIVPVINSGVRELRVAALKALSEQAISNDKFVPDIKKLFKEKDAEIRSLAIGAVVACKGENTIEALKELLTEETPEADLITAMTAILGNVNRDLTPFILPLLKYSKHTTPAAGEKSVRGLAAEILTKCFNLRGPDPVSNPDEAFRQWSLFWERDQKARNNNAQPDDKKKEEEKK